MSVHSNHYETEEEYLRDLQAEYSRPEYQEEETPFYTDDADDPHWHCENCGHCKEIKIHKRVMRWFPSSKLGDVVRPDDTWGKMLIERSWRDFEDTLFCSLRNCECAEDGYCSDFIEQEEVMNETE